MLIARIKLKEGVREKRTSLKSNSCTGITSNRYTFHSNMDIFVEKSFVYLKGKLKRLLYFISLDKVIL